MINIGLLACIDNLSSLWCIEFVDMVEFHRLVGFVHRPTCL